MCAHCSVDSARSLLMLRSHHSRRSTARTFYSNRIPEAYRQSFKYWIFRLINISFSRRCDTHNQWTWNENSMSMSNVSNLFNSHFFFSKNFVFVRIHISRDRFDRVENWMARIQCQSIEQQSQKWCTNQFCCHFCFARSIVWIVHSHVESFNIKNLQMQFRHCRRITLVSKLTNKKPILWFERQCNELPFYKRWIPIIHVHSKL